MKYPIQSFSWTVLSPTVALKHMDKSVFLHHGTGIPKNIYFFFNLSPEGLTARRPVTLIYAGQSFLAHFQLDAEKSRYRLFWRSDFSATIKSRFPTLYSVYSRGAEEPPERSLMRFEILSDREYIIDLVLSDIIRADVEEEILQESESRPEGRVRDYYGKRYERDPANRRDAIALHGLRCAACGFSFEETYGFRGAGYIEIHHTKPLAATGDPQLVDPKTDLVPLCANCHRMIHRFRNEVITMDELKQMINPYRIDKLQ